MEHLSHVIGAGHPPLLKHTIGRALELAVEKWGGDEALVSVHQGVRLTWADLAEKVDRFAAGLLALGLQPGDRVGLWASNCVEWTIVQFATARIGIIQVNINPAYRVNELQHTLRSVGVKALICADRFKTSDYLAMTESLLSEDDLGSSPMASATLPMLRYLIKIGGPARSAWLDFAAVSDLASEEERQRIAPIAASLDGDDPINIQFTSGTTGLPKAATLSHHNILNNGYLSGGAAGLKHGDRLCIPLPLYHCFGMVVGNLACLVHGATMIYPSPAFDRTTALRAIETERCTMIHGVPTMFIDMLEHPDFGQFDLSSLRGGLMGGAPCSIEIMGKVMDRMNMSDVGIAYGITETSPVSFQTAIDDTIERRVSTLGRVQPHLEVKIIDTATGETVQRGEVGELCTRGYSVMLGYWEDPAKTAEAIHEGWMHTGDLAVIDEDGYARIVGRIKDMVIRGGENIYPREIEEVIGRHSKVEDVHVVGVPDARLGEEICAWIKIRAGLSATLEEIELYCREKLAHYKVPRHLRFVSSFPMTVTGKVQKFEIRQTMMAELGLVDKE
ncbi:AMP-binding protein [Rhizorhapis suberifaciens]|uniref:3-methylmercaptopropionyl-CoA ligase n=1 Tax=Rhizorhapis suberifaciens TaxID=13656 RepID=A0A840HRC4_9SPHN|nr:AMP-binding protein [Rhizorhapis suberifaciens]MBB4640189.1 fatty-acyl-CoA synthase [Rhizorhapis suberifaciens]